VSSWPVLGWPLPLPTKQSTGSCDGSVDTVSTIRAGRCRVRFRTEIFLFFKTPRMTLRPTQSPLQWVSVTHPPEIKRPEHKADRPLRSSAEVKTRVAVNVPPLYVFTSVHLDRTLSFSFSLSPSVYQALSRYISIFNFLFLSFFLSFTVSCIFCFFLFLVWTARGGGARYSLRAEHPAESRVNTWQG
jgi:hypothetical protein